MKQPQNHNQTTHHKEHHNLKIILAGDLQHTTNNPLHRTTEIIPTPPHNILDLETQTLQLQSVKPHRHSEEFYHTRMGYHGAAGIDHIMAPANLTHNNHLCGVDHTPRQNNSPNITTLTYTNLTNTHLTQNLTTSP